jgi:tetratricopeptide (TPR) repeat protein
MKMTSKKLEEAIISFDKALGLNPDYVQAIYDRGRALSQLEKYEEAIASYNKALKIDSNNCQACNGKGEALVNLEQYEQAVKSYDRALELNPEDKVSLVEREKLIERISASSDMIQKFSWMEK